MTMTVEQLNDANCKTYLLTNGADAALVDPLREGLSRYRSILVERGLKLLFVVETHTHADHLMISRADRDALGVPYAQHRRSPSPLVDRHLSDGDTLRLGDDVITVLESPGHTNDSVCLLVSGAVLTGDTLSIGGSGRTDFQGGDAGLQFDVVTQRLFALPDDTVVWPGHDYKGRASSTIGLEKRTNPRFVGRSREAYIDVMAKLALPMPVRMEEALQVNQSGLEASEVQYPPVGEVATVATMTPAQLAVRRHGDAPPLVLDVREAAEFSGELGHVEGAMLVPLDTLERRLPEIGAPAGAEIVVVCRSGARSATAVAMLRRAGFQHVSNLAGGMVAWSEAGFPSRR